MSHILLLRNLSVLTAVGKQARRLFVLTCIRFVLHYGSPIHHSAFIGKSQGHRKTTLLFITSPHSLFTNSVLFSNFLFTFRYQFPLKVFIFTTINCLSRWLWVVILCSSILRHCGTTINSSWEVSLLDCSRMFRL